MESSCRRRGGGIESDRSKSQEGRRDGESELKGERESYSGLGDDRLHLMIIRYSLTLPIRLGNMPAQRRRPGCLRGVG